MTTKTVLVVEDEALISMAIEDMLTDAGHTVLGPVGSVAAALALLRNAERPDVALLDVNLRGERVFPVAAELRKLGVPFAFASGYGEVGVESAFGDVAVLTKPIQMAALLAFVAQVQNARGQRS